MQQYTHPLSNAWTPVRQWTAGAVLAAASGAAWSQGAAGTTLVAPGEALPPRLVLCQREVGAAEGERKALLRTCLARRLEGERAVQRDCKRQVGSVKGAQARQQAQIACERQALAVASYSLPRGAPRTLRPDPATTAEVRRPASSAVVPVGASARAPAAGEF